NAGAPLRKQLARTQAHRDVVAVYRLDDANFLLRVLGMLLGHDDHRVADGDVGTGAFAGIPVKEDEFLQIAPAVAPLAAVLRRNRPAGFLGHARASLHEVAGAPTDGGRARPNHYILWPANYSAQNVGGRGGNWGRKRGCPGPNRRTSPRSRARTGIFEGNCV